MAEAAKTVKQMVLEHEEFIHGNGKPGAKADLEVIKVRVGWGLWLNGAILIALIGAIIGYLR